MGRNAANWRLRTGWNRGVGALGGVGLASGDEGWQPTSLGKMTMKSLVVKTRRAVATCSGAIMEPGFSATRRRTPFMALVGVANTGRRKIGKGSMVEYMTSGSLLSLGVEI